MSMYEESRQPEETHMYIEHAKVHTDSNPSLGVWCCELASIQYLLCISASPISLLNLFLHICKIGPGIYLVIKPKSDCSFNLFCFSLLETKVLTNNPWHRNSKLAVPFTLLKHSLYRVMRHWQARIHSPNTLS